MQAASNAVILLVGANQLLPLVILWHVAVAAGHMLPYAKCKVSMADDSTEPTHRLAGPGQPHGVIIYLPIMEGRLVLDKLFCFWTLPLYATTTTTPSAP